MTREYPFYCKTCGFEMDLLLEMEELGTPQRCPKCEENNFVQDFGKKAKSLSVRIPHSFRATSYSFNAPPTSTYDKGADVNKIIADSDGDLE